MHVAASNKHEHGRFGARKHAILPWIVGLWPLRGGTGPVGIVPVRMTSSTLEAGHGNKENKVRRA